MNKITSIVLNNVEAGVKYKYIRNVLKKQQIASAGNIKIINSRKGYNNILIDIKKWHDTEVAYNFIKRIGNPSKEGRFVHSEDNWWAVRVHNRKSDTYKKY
jgi:hypothetical protein